MPSANGTPPQPARHAVDSHSVDFFDPSKNVLDLVKAESKYQDAMRDALKEQILAGTQSVKDQVKLIADSATLFQDSQRNAETRRIDELAQTRQEFQNTIRDMLAESVRTTSTLVSTQLVQIQATFDTRVSKLEAFQFTQAGRSSVADPALADALGRINSGLSQARSTQDVALEKMTATLGAIQASESRTGGQQTGKSDVNARYLAVIMAVAAVASPIIAILVMRGH